MILKGDSNRYGTLAATLHWISAPAILALLALGVMAARSSDPARTATLLRIHVPLGCVVLALSLIRVVWWFFDRRPGPPAGQPRWQRLAARATHLVFYGALVLSGGSGIGLIVLSGGAKTLIFAGTAAIPDFASLKPFAVHALGASIIVGLLGLHIAAVVYHQLYRRDRLLGRMGVGARIGDLAQGQPIVSRSGWR